MTWDQIFRLLILAVLVINGSISFVYRRRAEKQGGDLDPAGNRVLLFLRLAALVIMTPLIGFLINTDWMAWARYDGPLWLRWLGFASAISATPFLYWLFSTIGQNITPSHATRENHQLITSGPYRYVRHPLYTVGFTIFLGIGLMAAMWWLFAGMAMLAIVIAWRTGKEEEQLLKRFGDRYRSYMRKTGRYLPRLSRR